MIYLIAPGYTRYKDDMSLDGYATNAEEIEVLVRRYHAEYYSKITVLTVDLKANLVSCMDEDDYESFYTIFAVNPV